MHPITSRQAATETAPEFVPADAVRSVETTPPATSPESYESTASIRSTDAAQTHTLILTRDDIRQLVFETGLDSLMDEMIERLTTAMRTFNLDDADIPPRQGFRYTRPDPGLIEWMPCMYNGGRQATIKIVGYHPANARARSLPTILSTVSAYDTRSGHLICMMDGTLITALRTGAVSAIATRLMASSRSKTIGIIGSGAQAVTQIHALSRVVAIDRVLVFDIDPRAQASLVDRVHVITEQLDIEPASLAEVVESADVLCTVTSVGVGEGPVFSGIETRSWLHINAVGSDLPGKTELPVELLRNSFVCPDFRVQAVEEGECQQIHPEQIGPSLYELVQKPDQYLFVRERRSVFDSTGWALEDHVGMSLFMDRASELGVGTRVPIESISGDAHNPYHFGL